MEKERIETSTDKIKNHLSVFLSFDELMVEDFKNKNFIVSIYKSMNKSYGELVNLLKGYEGIEDLNKFSIAILLLKNYFEGYKKAKKVLQARDELKIKEIVSKILSVI
jgi:hypothetical protein